MFTYHDFIWQSDALNVKGVSHGFSTRLGGVSKEPHLVSMNTGFFRGDSDETVRENIKRLCAYAGVSEAVVAAPQIHSVTVRTVDLSCAGEGVEREAPQPCDGFVTAEADLTLAVRVADCAPLLLCGETAEGGAVIGAAHAGWRGTAAGIAAVTVEKMKALGAGNIRAAIGACIHGCCYEVGEDMRDAVAKMQSRAFADRHIRCRGGRLYADIAGMNREILIDAGAACVDVCPECTACKPYMYHSHRATGGKRGTMAALICIGGRR